MSKCLIVIINYMIYIKVPVPSPPYSKTPYRVTDTGFFYA